MGMGEQSSVQRLISSLEKEANAASRESKLAMRAARRSPLYSGNAFTIPWADYYLILGGKTLTPELTACLSLLSTSRLSYPLKDALARHLVTLGKDSTTYAFSRALWKGYNHALWNSTESAFGTEQLKRLLSLHPSPASTILLDLGSPYYFMPRATAHAVQSVLPQLGGSAGSSDSPPLLPHDIQVTGATAMEMASSDTPMIPWSDAVAGLVAYEKGIHQKRAHYILDAALIEIEVNIKHDSHRRGLRLILEEMAKNSREAEKAHPGSEDGNSLAIAMLLNPDAISRESMERFISMVDEYNVEWAFSAMEWNPSGKESKVASLTRRALELSPWNESREKESVKP